MYTTNGVPLHLLQANTFQCVLGTNGVQSFAMFLYADGRIQWAMGDRDEYPANIGFTNAFVESVYIPVSNTSDVINVATTSNNGIPGVWIFQIDSASIIVPGESLYGQLEKQGTGSGKRETGTGNGNGNGETRIVST